ncbi:MAG: YggS family pyridoxal phosphate-dependent enzyme [Bacteroidota bacterium]|jgi:pyridoxal phosphate enzyme (YggS family)
MSVNVEAYHSIQQAFLKQSVTLVAVSKLKPASDIEDLYKEGQRDFGENYVQELVDKQAVLPANINWHFIGHLQSNKVKYIAPFVHLIHGVDSLKLLQEINKQALKNNRVIDCLLQIHIAKEETKFGMDASELSDALEAAKLLPNVNIKGLMGMASFSDNQELVATEFKYLQELFTAHQFDKQPAAILSMGMSADYPLAIATGSNMVRIGSLLFGARVVKH